MTADTEAGAALADALDATLGPWVVACVEQRLAEAGRSVPPEVLEAARLAGEAAVRDIGRRVRALVEQDIDSQTTTPLSLVRVAVKYPTAVLRDVGLPPRHRDAFRVSRFPDDDFDLTPTSLAALGDDVGDLAIVWGASKAMAHRRRHLS
jgi:hypothetical protein